MSWSLRVAAGEKPSCCNGRSHMLRQRPLHSQINGFFFKFIIINRFGTGHSKHPLPTTQETTLHMDITRWSIPKPDWLYSLQPKTEKLYTVSKNKTQITMMVWSLQPDNLEWGVKWALGSITTNKASVGDGIPAKLIQILKDDAVKVLHSLCQKIWKPQKWPQAWKRSVFHCNPKERQCQRMFKLPHDCSHFTC